MCLPLHLYSPQRLQASTSILVPLCPPCFVGQGAVYLALIQGSCTGTELGAAAALVPVLVPGTLLSQHNLLTVCFSMSSKILASKLHISWDSIGGLLCSSEDFLGVPPVHRGKWALLPPTMPPSSCLYLFICRERGREGEREGEKYQCVSPY